MVSCSFCGMAYLDNSAGAVGDGEGGGLGDGVLLVAELNNGGLGAVGGVHVDDLCGGHDGAVVGGRDGGGGSGQGEEGSLGEHLDV